MKSFEIQFHKAKNAANKLKHQGISLSETEPVFYDERALAFQDLHPDEERWVIMGMDAKGRLLVVALPIEIRISSESFPRASLQKTSVAGTWRIDR
jgi:uncharacterized DUF497 family protein